MIDSRGKVGFQAAAFPPAALGRGPIPLWPERAMLGFRYQALRVPDRGACQLGWGSGRPGPHVVTSNKTSVLGGPRCYRGWLNMKDAWPEFLLGESWEELQLTI